MRQAYLFGFFLHDRKRPCPDNVIQAHIVCKKHFLACFKINDGCQVRLVQTKIIQERTVLPEMVCVAAVIAGGFPVSHEQAYSFIEF